MNKLPKTKAMYEAMHSCCMVKIHNFCKSQISNRQENFYDFQFVTRNANNADKRE